MMIIYPDDLDHSDVNLIIHNWDLEIPVGKFGTNESRQKVKHFNIRIAVVHPELNSGGIGQVRKLILLANFLLLECQDCQASYFSSVSIHIA